MGNCCCSTGANIKADRSELLRGDTDVVVWDSLGGKTILRNFRAPGKYSGRSTHYFCGQGSLAVSNERIVCHGSLGMKPGVGTVLNVPWSHPSVQHIQFKVAGSGQERCLVITVDHHIVDPKRSGLVEYHFQLGEDAVQWLQRIQKLQLASKPIGLYTGPVIL